MWICLCSDVAAACDGNVRSLVNHSELLWAVGSYAQAIYQLLFLGYMCHHSENNHTLSSQIQFCCAYNVFAKNKQTGCKNRTLGLTAANFRRAFELQKITQMWTGAVMPRLNRICLQVLSSTPKHAFYSISLSISFMVYLTALLELD